MKRTCSPDRTPAEADRRTSRQPAGAARQRLVDLVHVEVVDLDATVAALDEVQAVAQAGGDLVLEGCALVHAAWSHLLRGQFATAARCLDRAEDVFDEATVDGLWEPSLLHACRGALHTWRGEAGDAHFERAQQAAAVAGAPAGAVVSAALRADVVGDVDDVGDVEGVRADVLGSGSATPSISWAVRWARRGRATGALAAGDLDRAEQVLDGLVAGHDGMGPPNPIERGRTLLLQGEVQLRRGDGRAAATLARAATLLVASGARFPGARALLLLADADTGRAAEAVGRARDLSSSDPAFVALWDLRPRFDVVVLGRQAVCVGGQRLALSGNAARLVHLLAFAGPYGRHWERVADQLWPQVLDPRRAASNVSSLTRNTRARLGAEAWRLRREGPMLFFDLDHGGLDLADELATVARCLGTDQRLDPERLDRALDLLRRPVLPDWADAPWVCDVDAWRAERVASLTDLLARSSTPTATGRAR